MKTIIIPDLHGNIEALNTILKKYNDAFFVFLGDVIDSHTQPVGIQIECVKKAKELVEKGCAEYLIGNHEVSYLSADQRCSGWSSVTSALIDGELSVFLRERTKLATQIGNYVITHAGITEWFYRVFLKYVHKDHIVFYLNSLWREAGKQYDMEALRLLSIVGRKRGGRSIYGGPLWADVSEHKTLIPHTIPFLQIFGHTLNPGKVEEIRKGEYCIDCYLETWPKTTGYVAVFEGEKLNGIETI